MLVTLLHEKKLNMVYLPDKVKGQYWLQKENESGELENIIVIEAMEGVWRIKSNKHAYLSMGDGSESYKSAMLSEHSVFGLALQDNADMALVMTEPDTEDRKKYSKYKVDSAKMSITIGRIAENTICYAVDSVSSIHATLNWNNGSWSVTDKHSTNGTYVNNEKENQTRKLKYGDVIYIMGMKIIVCNGFFAINNPDKKVSVKNENITLMTSETIREIGDDISLTPVDYYCRSPRFKRDIIEKKITVDSPPPSYNKEEMPLIMVLGPSITMGIASITTASYSIYNAVQNGNMSSAIPALAMSVSMLLGTILWPVISKKYEKKRNREKEVKRINKYTKYLNDIENQVDEELKNQKMIIEENNTNYTILYAGIKNGSKKLWERTIGQNDFLHIRLGLGERDLNVKFMYQTRKFTMDEDELQDRMLNICENPPKLKNVPITVSLVEDNVLGIIGDEKNTRDFINNIILQIACQYSYDEVKMAFIMSEHDESMMRYVRRIPHVWDNENSVRFIATNSVEVKEISNYIEQEIENRREMKDGEMASSMPYYVIFVLNKRISDKAEMLKQIYRHKGNMNMSVVYVADIMRNLPKECSKFVELNNDRAEIYDKNNITGKRITFKPDYYVGNTIPEITSLLARTQLDLTDSAYNLPKMLTFLDIYGVGKVEHLNAEKRWRENNPVKSLEAPIGVDTTGELFKLDLHEKFHGPHGLVAGMTGSGKSEFIMSMILSMALNYHPYEVAFVLIDYKGGGMAKSFERLPHTAGIITNLDGGAVKRSLISIQSELKRRQAIFSESGKAIGESNIDIYKYQKLYREGKVTEPLQHLFIISDEFAELKTQQPEFMEQLVSAARIGRSLGVHLILATQKPAGVVDDQIWSNSRFRICLKVQDRADSMDMLKRPDAASLSDTGRFYLQVGYNELFELGQSAWSGAPYIPSEKVVKHRDTSVELLDRCGNVLLNQKIEHQTVITNPKKQMDEITDYLAAIAKEEHINIRKLWLEPIPGKIFVELLRCKYNHSEQHFKLNPIIGEYDDPARQRQCLLTLPFSDEGNAIVYGTAGNGKTTFLTTMLYSLISSHTPDEVQSYILDFSSETLRAFKNAPHVGDVLVSGDDEKIANLFKMLNSELQRRKQICSEFGGDYVSYIAAGNIDIPNIVIVINNYAGFAELYEDYEEFVQFQSREGIKYGIYFVLTALTTSAVRFRLQQNFKQLLVLQMNDAGEYSTVLGSTGGMIPSKIKGRGLFKEDGVYEFQTAYAFEDIQGIFENVKAYSKQLLDYYGMRNIQISTMPEHVTLSNFDADVTLEHFPIAYEKEKLEEKYINMVNPPITVISAGVKDKNKKIINGMLDVLMEMEDIDVVLWDGEGSIGEDEVSCELVNNDFETSVQELFDKVLYRNNHYKDCNGVLADGESYSHLVVFLYKLGDVREQLSDDGVDKLKILMEKNEPQYHVEFVVIDDESTIAYRFKKEKWYTRHNPTMSGIYLGDNFVTQSVFSCNAPNNVARSIGSEFGFIVENGVASLVKFIESRTEAEDE